jgi:peptidoglycan/xylan/chitin deacetylase (PgdA/CDA1 family)
VSAALPVLMYHSAPESGPGSHLAVPRELIDRQWHALVSEGWTLRGLTEALDLARTDPAARIVAVTFDDGYRDFLGVPDLLAKHDARATLYLPTSYPDIAERGSSPWLSWQEAVSLPGELVEIGSHAHAHRPLDVLVQDDLDYEVRHSRQLLTERLGAQPRSFCYPNGYSSQRVRRSVSAAGYANACVIGRCLADPAGPSYAVPRLQVTPVHDETSIVRLVGSGEAGLTPTLKRIAYPAWRMARFATYRTTGKMLT